MNQVRVQLWVTGIDADDRLAYKTLRTLFTRRDSQLLLIGMLMGQDRHDLIKPRLKEVS